jgi:predicted amidohydrolase
MGTELKVSVASIGIRPYPSLDACRLHLEPFVAAAASAGSSLLLLPELLCVGLLWADPAAADTTRASAKGLYQRVLNPLFPVYQDMLRALARKHQIHLAGASYWHERDGLAVNTAFWCRADGSMETQDKLHPTRAEQAIDTVGGKDVRVFELEEIKIGLLICYDIQFPELARGLVDGGVEVLLVPSFTDTRGYWRVRHCAHARAVENQIFVCVSPLIGSLGIPNDWPVERHGAALIACPIDNRFGIDDGTYQQGTYDSETVIHAILNLETLRRSRMKSEIMQLKDRRPDLYGLTADQFKSWPLF